MPRLDTSSVLPGPVRAVACLAILCLATVAAGNSVAHAAKAKKNLWATINLCDTQAHPNELGVRARMPGNGLHQRMYMRFFAEYRTSDGSWHHVAVGGASPWEYAGSALFTYEELGYTFSFDQLAPGEGYTMRGLVKFQWRAHGKVLRRAQLLSTADHPSKHGDPPHYSTATCFVSG
jgi:hypothetical protein